LCWQADLARAKHDLVDRIMDDICSLMGVGMPLNSKKISTATLRQQIVHEVRQAILNGTLHPGERLVERNLAASLGTSLTAAREAMIQLESEGLITKRPNSTTHVTQLSPEEISQIFAVRRVLEEFAFVEAARHGTPQENAKLEQIHTKALRFAEAGDARAYIAQDLSWHQTVWSMSHNPYLYGSLSRAILPLFGFSVIRVAMQEGFDLVEDARDHEPLLRAIAGHDVAATRRAYRAAADNWSEEAQKAASGAVKPLQPGPVRLTLK
jgi:DNA-binding GntR family transcriptional regulator